LQENVAQYSYENFILVPVGTNQVRCIHSCFVFGELGKASKVAGLLGYRRTSPFKTLNIEHAVKPFSGPRTTRASEEKLRGVDPYDGGVHGVHHSRRIQKPTFGRRRLLSYRL
jgi:hypothetical protein